MRSPACRILDRRDIAIAAIFSYRFALCQCDDVDATMLDNVNHDA
jgi:hypothetical protein